MAGKDAIEKLVGGVTGEQLRYVDCFVAGDVGMFMPVGGACFYALTPRHTHPAYMFVLPFNDQTSLSIDGRIITPEPGRMLALSPDIPHHELPSDSPPRYVAILINKELFNAQLSDYLVVREVTFRGESFGISDGLLPLVKRFMVEADNDTPGSVAVLQALGVEICHAIIRGIFGVPPPVDRIASRMEINRAVEYIHGNLAGKVTVEDIAAVARMSPSHFARTFREETGKPPIEYLNQARMERVKKLLLAGDKTITEIALECGFCSSAYLSACFHKRFGMPPSEYRKGLK